MFDWITGLIDGMGPLGVGLLMFLENVFPPIPSELIMPLAGFNAARGDMSLIAVIGTGSIGSLAGAYLWYWIGRRIGFDRVCRLSRRHGRWLSVSPEEFDRANGWFNRHGGMAVLIGRLIPTVRTFISVPAGVNRMPRGSFLALSALGTVAWTALLTLSGYWLESGYEVVGAWLDPVSTAVVVGLVAVYLWRVATYRRRGPEEREA
ncbi:DedA family protein [Psychromarinibacter sp. C21-152]|uniref:DedA family protein n=1 Tax=Psychromarinibacter sediminicola TaxID=3033385 RepID=A0AAE3TB09_9RHOB|nr:DedA family protein [Psychromarinibacter sediminicola]MDF0602170.1 DedA family protein [Psychromarinibacter sediminicola]